MVTYKVTYHTCFVNLSLMKITSKIKEISSMILSFNGLESTLQSIIEFEKNIGR